MLTTTLVGALLCASLAQQTDTIVPVEPGSRLEIESFGGEVVIRTWTRNEMRVAADHSSRTGISVRKWGSTVSVGAESYRGPASVDYNLTVPENIDVEIGGTFVDVDIDGVAGEIRVRTTQGDLRVRGGRGYVSLHTTTGSAELEGAAGSIAVHSVSGSVSVTDAEGDIEAETTSGNVVLENIRSGDVRAVTTSGRVHYSGGIQDGGRYFLSSHSGNVMLAAPEDFNANVTVSTFSGNLDSDFPITIRGTTGRSRRISFTLGTGSARLELESFSGNVELRRWGGRR
jgi:DUF4097 and DUF4098 domain-containing protein YvlB